MKKLYKNPKTGEVIFMEEEEAKKHNYVPVEDETKAQAQYVETRPCLYKFFVDNLLEGQPDLVMLFGETGSGKSTIALKLFEDAQELGHNALFIDTEGNLRPNQRPKNYEYVVRIEDVEKIVKSLKPGCKLVIVDSIGLPVLGAYASASLKKRGDMLLKMQGIAYMLKSYAINNNCLVVITNQPVSEMSVMDIPDENERRKAIENRRPFGDKMVYFSKELLRTKLVEATPNRTVMEVDTWRSRKYGRGTKLFRMVWQNGKLSLEFMR